MVLASYNLLNDHCVHVKFTIDMLKIGKFDFH